MPNIETLRTAHLNFFENHEQKEFQRARQFYRGEWMDQSSYEGLFSGANAASNQKLMYFASKNIVFGIADTAISSLLGSNPRVAPVPLDPNSRTSAPAIGGLMDWCFRVNKMRRKTATGLIDSVLCKRGIYKTSWDSKKGQPLVTNPDPSRVFFDLTVRDPDHISYWLEAIPVPWEKFKKLVKSGEYTIPEGKTVEPDGYPKWMLNTGQREDALATLNAASRFVTVWEYYDIEREKVIHYVPSIGANVLEDRLAYNPYTLFSLNMSGIDCLGHSEISLVLDSQRTINDLLTHWKSVVYKMVPHTLFDSSRVKTDAISQMVRTPAGDYFGVDLGDSVVEGGTKLSDLFFPSPTPDVSTGVKELLAQVEENVAFESALAEAARGRVTGAKSATEMAIIDAYNRTRLAMRESNVADAHEDVAKKMLWLCSRFMKKPKMVRVSQGRDFEMVNLKTLRTVDMDFEMVSYNPLRRNPAVVLETLVQLLPVISQAPNVDVVGLIEVLVDRLGLPPEILKDGQQVRKMLEDQQAAAAGGGAPPGEPPVEAGGVAEQANVTDLEALKAQLAASGRAASSGGSPAGPAAAAQAPALAKGRPPMAGTGSA